MAENSESKMNISIKTPKEKKDVTVKEDANVKDVCTSIYNGFFLVLEHKLCLSNFILASLHVNSFKVFKLFVLDCNMKNA